MNFTNDPTEHKSCTRQSAAKPFRPIFLLSLSRLIEKIFLFCLGEWSVSAGYGGLPYHPEEVELLIQIHDEALP